MNSIDIFPWSDNSNTGLPKINEPQKCCAGENLKKILLVDDEQNVLNALQRELKEHFEIETFDNPVTALKHCRDTQFDVAIADYMMPEMNGIEFLNKFGLLQPDASRLVLSGKTDIDTLIRTINETHIYHFLAKPWDKEELLSSIRQALTYREAIANAHHDPAVRVHQDDMPYRIVLVESDSHLLTLISRGLSDESGHENLCGAIQQEIKQSNQTKRFKCVVDAFLTAQAAFVHIEKHPCDLIISGQALPDMDGIQLLSKMRRSLPDAARILLCNDPNKTLLSQAINEAEVQNVLPLHWHSYERADVRRQAWNIYQLKAAVIQAFASRKLLGH